MRMAFPIGFFGLAGLATLGLTLGTTQPLPANSAEDCCEGVPACCFEGAECCEEQLECCEGVPTCCIEQAACCDEAKTTETRTTDVDAAL